MFMAFEGERFRFDEKAKISSHLRSWLWWLRLRSCLLVCGTYFNWFILWIQRLNRKKSWNRKIQFTQDAKVILKHSNLSLELIFFWVIFDPQHLELAGAQGKSSMFGSYLQKRYLHSHEALTHIVFVLNIFNQ